MALYGYCRVSTDEQVNGTSLDDQKRIVMTAGVPAENVFIDDGVSGSIKLTDRPRGSELLKALQPGDTLVAAKLDRMFRSASDATNQVETLKERGVHVILCDLGPLPITDNGVSRLFFVFMSGIAEFERGLIKERTTNGQRAKKAKGGHIGGHTPFGFHKEGKEKEAKLFPIPEEQEAIKQIHKMRSEGKTIRHITETIQAQGLKISKATVHRILDPETKKRRKPWLKRKKDKAA